MTGPGETAAAAPKGNAEALRQKGRTTTILRRVRPVRTPKVQPAPAGNLSGNGRRHEAKGPCVSDCQKTCQAKSFGGKKSVKGNRQGVLSRSITRRSGQNCKIELQDHFAILPPGLTENPAGTFSTGREGGGLPPSAGLTNLD